jgi:hypothetical protein
MCRTLGFVKLMVNCSPKTLILTKHLDIRGGIPHKYNKKLVHNGESKKHYNIYANKSL